MSIIMKHLPTIARYLLGLIFFVFGLNKFLNFLPAPEMSADAGAFFGALVATGYMMKFIGATEVIGGLLLLINKYTPVALIILAPVSINILVFHLALDIASIPVGGLTFLLNVYLLFAYKKYYDPMLASSASPGSDSE